MKMRGLCVLVGTGLLVTHASAALQPATSSLEQSSALVESTHGPAMLARRCVHEIGRTARSTIHDVAYLAQHGVEQIYRLAMNGAPDGAIAESARRSIEAIHQRAAAGAERVNTIADHCARALHDAGADSELIELVNRARHAALARIGDSVQHASDAVRLAADRAIGG